MGSFVSGYLAFVGSMVLSWVTRKRGRVAGFLELG